jgi:hypothetical protein
MVTCGPCVHVQVKGIGRQRQGAFFGTPICSRRKMAKVVYMHVGGGFWHFGTRLFKVGPSHITKVKGSRENMTPRRFSVYSSEMCSSKLIRGF